MNGCTILVPLENPISEKYKAPEERKRHISDLETGRTRLRSFLRNRKRADSEMKKAKSPRLRNEGWKKLVESERDLKEKEQAVGFLWVWIYAVESQIHLLQQEIAVSDWKKKELNLYQELVSEKEAEINQLKKLAEKERTRAESGNKKWKSWDLKTKGTKALYTEPL